MKMVEVTGKAVTIRYGTLLLNAEQAAARKYALRPTGLDDVYEVLKPTSFKHGEQFGYDGPELSRAVQVNLGEPEDEQKPELSAKEKALSAINPDADVPVALLKDALEKNNIADTCKLLAGKYGLTVKKGTDTVPPDVFAKIAEDYGFEFEEEPVDAT